MPNFLTCQKQLAIRFMVSEVYSKAQTTAVLSLLDRVKTSEARQALLFLVSAFDKSSGVTPTPGEHGYLNDFRFLINNENYFAFTANKSWLLWYFRRPAFSSGLFDEEEVIQAFPSAEKTTLNELKLKISSYDEAAAVLRYVTDKLTA